MFGVYWSREDQSAAAYCFRYHHNKCCFGDRKIINIRTGTTNRKCFIRARRWYSTMARFDRPKAAIFITSDATVWCHTRSHSIHNHLHEYYKCGHSVWWVIWWAKNTFQFSILCTWQQLSILIRIEKWNIYASCKQTFCLHAVLIQPFIAMHLIIRQNSAMQERMQHEMEMNFLW